MQNVVSHKCYIPAERHTTQNCIEYFQSILEQEKN